MTDDNGLFEEFVVEAREHLEDIEGQLLRLEAGGDEDLVNTLFRAVHTIKGGSGFLGLDQVNLVAHAMENVLDRIRTGRLKPSRTCIEPLLRGADLLQRLIEGGGSGDPAVAERISGALTAVGREGHSEPVLAPDDRILEFLDDDERPADVPRVARAQVGALPAEHHHWYLLAYDLSDAAWSEERSIFRLFTDLEATGSLVGSRLRAADLDLRAGLPDNRLTLEILYASLFEPPLIAEAVGLPESAVRCLQPVPAESAATDRLAPPAPAAPSKAHGRPQTTAAAKREAAEAPAPGSDRKKARQVVRVDLALLDDLMNLAGELVLVRNRQLQLVTDDDADPRVRKLVSQLSMVTNELQEAVMRTRMLEVGTVFAKLPRLVRDLAHKLHKQIRLEAHGNDVELDKTILEAIGDPLLHLVRNACDHGMDRPGEREAAGKDPEGTIRVAARHQAGQIVIEIADDGPGIDRDRVLATAIANDLVTTKEAEGMEDRAVHALIMRPGFSTAAEITEVSGRGVGMDVVKSAIEGLGGSVEVDSDPGHGTTFTMRLPLTLAIISGLIVRSREHRYAIPQVSIEEVVSIYREDIPGRIEYADHQAVYRLRDEILPLVWLDEVLASREPITSARAAEAAAARQTEEVQTKLSFIVIRNGSQRYGLVVDEIIGSEDIVVKPMHPALVGLRAFSGSTILGDGGIALILDANGLVDHAGVELSYDQSVAEGGRDGQPYRHEDHFAQLVFEIGCDRRCALPLPLIRRVVTVTADQLERVGDRRYLRLDGENILLVDVGEILGLGPEAIPDGCQVILPRHLNRPVGIVAHRIVDVVQRYPEPSDESFHGAGVIGSAVVGERMTIFLDLFGIVQEVEPGWFEDRLPAGVAHGEVDERPARILLVEDTRFFQRLVARYLTEGGHTVVVAGNGREALAVLEEEAVDMIVCDIEMPIMDGIAFITALRRSPDHRHLPALALSALCHKEISDRALAAGFDGYEVKIDREQLLTAVAGVRSGRPSTAA